MTVRDMLRVVLGRFEGRPHEHHLLLSGHSEKTQRGCTLHAYVCHRPSVVHLSIVRVPCTSGRQYVCVKANVCVSGLACQNPVRVSMKGDAPSASHRAQQLS